MIAVLSAHRGIDISWGQWRTEGAAATDRRALHVPCHPRFHRSIPVASQPLLNAVKQQLGVVPNLFRLVGNSPAAPEAISASTARWPKQPRCPDPASGSPWRSPDQRLRLLPLGPPILARISPSSTTRNRRQPPCKSNEAKADAAVRLAVRSRRNAAMSATPISGGEGGGL